MKDRQRTHAREKEEKKKGKKRRRNARAATPHRQEKEKKKRKKSGANEAQWCSEGREEKRVNRWVWGRHGASGVLLGGLSGQGFSGGAPWGKNHTPIYDGIDLAGERLPTGVNLPPGQLRASGRCARRIELGYVRRQEPFA